MVLDEVVLRYPEADRDGPENLELGVVAGLRQSEKSLSTAVPRDGKSRKRTDPVELHASLLEAGQHTVRQPDVWHVDVRGLFGLCFG